MVACEDNTPSTVAKPVWDSVALQYANNFKVQQQGSYTLLSIGAAWKNAQPTFQYLLYPKDSTPPISHPKAIKIPVPAERILCSGSVDVAFLKALGAEDKIVGLSNGQYLYDPSIQLALARGKITNIGQDQGVDYERAMATQPDLAFVYSIGNQNTYKKYQNLGIPAVMLSDFMETSPLGRAEWLLFVSYFIGKEQEAQAYFDNIVQEYQQTKTQAALYSSLPTVLTGAVYKGTWYVAGGQSLMATFIKDAGGAYLWKENKEVSGVPLDFEAVYAKALKADIWINQSHYATKAALLAAEPNYQDFKAVQKNQLYNYYKRASANGGTDFFESGIVRPDLVLKDLVHLFHEQPVESDSLYYYQPLKEQ